MSRCIHNTALDTCYIHIHMYTQFTHMNIFINVVLSKSHVHIYTHVYANMDEYI